MRFKFAHVSGQEAEVEVPDDASAWAALRESLGTDTPVTKLMQVWQLQPFIEFQNGTRIVGRGEPAEVRGTGRSRIAMLPDDGAVRFHEFHRANPHVYDRLRGLAMRQVEAGRVHGGIAQLFEVLRYEHSLRTSGDEFKLNNNYRAHYARLLMEREPRLSGFFQTRASRADDPNEERYRV